MFKTLSGEFEDQTAQHKEMLLTLEDFTRESPASKERLAKQGWDSFIEQQKKLSTINFQLHALRNM